jgi:hypothetical protein
VWPGLNGQPCVWANDMQIMFAGNGALHSLDGHVSGGSPGNSGWPVFGHDTIQISTEFSPTPRS